MKTALFIIQIIVSLSLICLILLQSRGGGLGTAFGGAGVMYRSKRGVEKLFTYLTVVLAILFFILAIVELLT